MAHCPYCGRMLTLHERFCYHCEQDIGKFVDKEERPTVPKPKPYQLKKDWDKYKEMGKNILSKLKRRMPVITAYCLKCKKKINIKNPKNYIMKNDMASVKGLCPVCSTKVFRILGKK
ncbi:MAG: DUF5679 domain-containing protein [Nanoarchaeota archaeon]